MSNKVMIVGTGNVGASIAFAILNQRTPINELVLTDIIAKDAEGEAMDLRDALAVAPSYVKISNGTYRDARDCDIVVITAGAAQRKGEKRIDLLKRNANVLKGMIEQIMASGFNGIFIVVTNPVDVLSYLTWRYSGLPNERVIGTGTVLDSARLKERIAGFVNVNPKSVHAYQVGEHGDSEFALWSSATVGGQPVTKMLPEKTLDEIEDFVKNEAYMIINNKGATHYGISVCVCQIINCILNNERRVLPVSTYHSYEDVYYGYPAVVGRNGIIREIEPKITEKEGIKLAKTVNILRSAINTLKLDQEKHK